MLICTRLYADSSQVSGGRLHLQLDVRKTRELVVDMRRNRTPVTPVSIHGANDKVEENKSQYKIFFISLFLKWLKKKMEVKLPVGQSITESKVILNTMQV